MGKREFSDFVKCPWGGNCKEIHIDNFVDHVNDYHNTAANQKHVCPLCEMYSPGLYLQQNQNTRLVDHLNQIHATVEDLVCFLIYYFLILVVNYYLILFYVIIIITLVF